MNMEQFNHLMLDNLSTAVVLVNPRLQIMHLNPAAENLLGAGANRLKGSSFSLFLANSNEDDSLRTALSEGSMYTCHEASLHLASHQDVTVTYTVTPLREYQMVLLEIQPIDRIMRINREEALLSTHSTSKDLILGLAHEVKNPLGGIKGAAQLLAMELSKEHQEFTDVIIAETNRLTNLVDKLLGPTHPLQITTLNIHSISEYVAKLLKVECGENILLIRDYDPSIPEIEGDREQLIQVILNISQNAMQALLESGTKDASITFRTRVKRNFSVGRQLHKVICKLEIIDNGPGINPEIAERIFFPMISDRNSGSGLGLPISQTIINRHQGLIECESKTGKTIFKVFLPLEHNESINEY
jgi:two-component system nitrogen regulation sensor histidine kinase GlnL